MRFNCFVSPACSLPKNSSSELVDFVAMSSPLSFSLRFSAISFAFLSFLSALNSSPACGTSVNPSTSTAIPGTALCNFFPFALTIDLILPEAVPATTLIPTFKVPFITSNVAMAPLLLSSFASITLPSASLLGFALNSKTSACNKIISRRSFIPSPFLAET